MEAARLRVVTPGLLTTVQDLGRPKFQRFGMPVSGAMDQIALRAANRLVGNPDGAAGLEITLLGPELVFDREAVIAITGGDLSPVLDGKPVSMLTAIAARRGCRLAFGARRGGARAYLAVAGGLEVPVILGSRATHIRSGTGGLAGRALAKGDLLCGGLPSGEAEQCVGRTVPRDALPAYAPIPTLRAVRGPQADQFAPEAFDTLVTGTYTLTAQADRMGYRLSGPPLIHAGSADIVSDATPCGAVQVPGTQQPILLMADCQTTGGYPKIAVVISSDLPEAAQLAPGDRVRFALVELAAAQAAARQQWARLAAVLPPVPC